MPFVNLRALVKELNSQNHSILLVTPNSIAVCEIGVRVHEIVVKTT